MKIEVKTQQIADVLEKIEAVAPRRLRLPNLSNVLLRTEKNKLCLRVTSLELHVEQTIDAVVTQPGSTTLPAHLFSSILKELEEPSVEISVEQDIAKICCGSSFFKLVGLSELDFPSLPPMENVTNYSMSQSLFRKLLKGTSFAASTDVNRYILNGSLFSFMNKKLVVVATDGKRLALAEQNFKVEKQDEKKFVIPSKTIDQLVSMLGEEGQVQIRVSEGIVAFEFENTLIVSKQIDGQYPNYRRVIPSCGEIVLTVDREALIKVIRRVGIIGGDSPFKTIKLDLANKNRLEVSLFTPLEIGEAEDSIPVCHVGKQILIGFNPYYLLDSLLHLEDREIILEFTDALSPVVIKSGTSFLHVLMPKKI